MAAAATSFAFRTPAEARAESTKPLNMHVSLAAYSVREALNGGVMDLFGFIDR